MVIDDAGRVGPGTARGVILLIHRYSGLVMALFLAITGITGSVIGFGEEIDAWLNPDLFLAPVSGPAWKPTELAAAAEAADPRIRVVGLPLSVTPGQSLLLRVAPRIDEAKGKPFVVDFTEIFLDPYTGAVIGRRSDALGIDRRHLVTTLRKLHASLLLGSPGRMLLGSIAIIWVVNCFLGLWLTLPQRRPRLTRWLAAWRIRRGSGSHRFTLDLHRAAALWLWLVLLALAVSSVHLGLSQAVFRPLVSLFSPLTPSLAEQGASRRRATPIPPRLTIAQAISAAKSEANARGWELRPSAIFALPLYGVYSVRLTPSGEDSDFGLGPTRLFIDDQDGHVVTDDVPGQGTRGDIFIQLQFPLHSGEIAGLAGRVVVAVAGVVVAMLSVTGVLIWLQKRRLAQKVMRMPP